MSRCIPCELKRQRLQHKLNATRERATQWATDNRSEVVIYIIPDDDGDDDVYSFGSTLPDGATVVEYIGVFVP